VILNAPALPVLAGLDRHGSYVVPKPGTAAFYRHLLDKIIKPDLVATKADKVTRAQVARLHGKLKATPFQANRVLAVIGSMYTFASRRGIVAEGVNPARRD
jgi:GTP-binding protein EngB required for normal cell division